MYEDYIQKKRANTLKGLKKERRSALVKRGTCGQNFPMPSIWMGTTLVVILLMPVV
jgi:hypothetical protein